MGKWSIYNGHEGQYFVSEWGRISHLIKRSFQDYYLTDTGERIGVQNGEFFNSYEEAWNSFYSKITEGGIVVSFGEVFEATSWSTQEWNGRDSDELCGHDTVRREKSVQRVFIVLPNGIKAVVISCEATPHSSQKQMLPSAKNYVLKDGKLHRLTKEGDSYEKTAIKWEDDSLFGDFYKSLQNLFPTRDQVFADFRVAYGKEASKIAFRYMADETNEPLVVYATQKTSHCEVRVLGSREQVGSTVNLDGQWADQMGGAIDKALQESFSGETWRRINKELWTKLYTMSPLRLKENQIDPQKVRRVSSTRDFSSLPSREDDFYATHEAYGAFGPCD